MQYYNMIKISNTSLSIDDINKKTIDNKRCADNTNKLWPLFIFDTSHKIILDSCISMIFDTIDIDKDESSKYALQLHLHKIIGRLFGISKSDFLSPLIKNDVDPNNLKSIYQEIDSSVRIMYRV